MRKMLPDSNRPKGNKFDWSRKRAKDLNCLLFHVACIFQSWEVHNKQIISLSVQLLICKKLYQYMDTKILQVDRVIPVSGDDAMLNFSHLFTETTKKDFSDDHLWFSVSKQDRHRHAGAHPQIQPMLNCWPLSCVLAFVVYTKILSQTKKNYSLTNFHHTEFSRAVSLRYFIGS